MEALTQVAAARQPVKDAVYRYWLDKRKQLGKPLLRRLQAPTNSSDTNPHSCFRCSPLVGVQLCCLTPPCLVLTMDTMLLLAHRVVLVCVTLCAASSSSASSFEPEIGLPCLFDLCWLQGSREDQQATVEEQEKRE